MSERLAPIPIPWSVRWRAWQRAVVPVLVFSTVIAVLAMQWHKLDGGGIPGVAEGMRSAVTCPQPAVLQELSVGPFEWVEAGQPVAVVVPSDPKARLDLLKSQLQLARLKTEPSLAEQNALDFERLRVEHLRLKEELAVAEVELRRAENVLQRNTVLRKDKLVSEDAYDLSLRDRDKSLAEITEKRKSLQEVEGRLVALRPIGEPEHSGKSQPLQALVAHLDSRLLAAETDGRSLILRAPIRGMVQMVNRQPGEFVPEGEPLLVICSAKADRIVGYMRQPYSIEPEVGMNVEVCTRTRQRRKFLSEVIQIGAQTEMITNALAVMRPYATVDVGLPVIVRVPPQVSIRPGETVDILFLAEAAGSRGRNRQALSDTPMAARFP